MQSKETTVKGYLASLPPDRREALEAVRRVILANLDKDYEEGMGYGMMGYYVPHRVYPHGYHCNPEQPLPFAGLASQKQAMSVYLMCLYGQTSEMAWFSKAWAKTGKKLDMGKCCIRFKKVEDLALDVIGEAIRRMPAKKYIAEYERLLATTKSGRAHLEARAKKVTKGGPEAPRSGAKKAANRPAPKPRKGPAKKSGKKVPA